VLLPGERSVCPERVATPLSQGTSSLISAGALACVEQGSGVPAKATAEAKVILDFGREMSGSVEVRMAPGSAPGQLSVSYSESLAYLTGRCDELGIEGIAVPTGYHVPTCPRSVSLKGGAETWTDPYPRSGFRYALLTFIPRSPGKAMQIDGAGIPDYSPSPQDASLAPKSAYAGWFLSSDDALNQYWYDGAYTAQVDTVAAGQAGLFYEGISGLERSEPVMVDGAKRDRYIWYDLAGPKTLVPLLYGDAQTPRDTLLALGQIQTAKGFIPACRPPASFYGAPCTTAWTDATGWWVIALGEYWLWTGDTQLAVGAYPAVQKALGALASCQTANGLIAACNGTATYDESNPGPGPSTYLNAVYYQALMTGSRLARVAGNDSDASRYELAAARLRAAINRGLWDPVAKAYICTDGQPDCHSQDANVLPALWNIASPEMKREALEYVKKHLWTAVGTRTGSAGLDFGTPVRDLVANWISYFEMQARLQQGASAEVDTMLEAAWRYMDGTWKKIPGPQGNTEEPPSTTTWEHIVAPGGGIFRGPQSSLSHVWSAGATVIESTGFLGITPAEPGFSAWTIRPRADGSQLTWAEGQVPTPHGPIRVHWYLQGVVSAPGAFTLEVDAPRGTTGTVYVPLYGHSRAVTEDGKPIGSGVAEAEDLRLPGITGRHVFAWR
jgi:hypothetical protein